MNFVSYTDLCRDVIRWSQDLPKDIDLVVGLPRSGMMPAAILALHRNIPLVDVDTFASGKIFDGGFRDQHRKIKTVLVVDDSVLSGRSMVKAYNKLKHITEYQIMFGAVYVKPGSQKFARLNYRIMTLPRVFEWNMFHSYWTQHCCMDIDGVLCRDPTREENDDGLRYIRFLNTVSVNHAPTVQVHTLVTNRLEKYRTQTVTWLHRNNIVYQNLVMHPASSKKERMSAKDHAQRKARAYIKSGTRLFIESSESQAQAIHRLTHQPVICTDTMIIHA